MAWGDVLKCRVEVVCGCGGLGWIKSVCGIVGWN